MSNGDLDRGDFLQLLCAAGRAEPGPECPSEERLRLLAVGLTDASESRRLLAHAATCDCCGPLLREAVEDLAEPPTEEEIQLAATTRLAQPRHRRAFAKRLAGPRRQMFGWRLALAGVLVALLAIAGPEVNQWFSSLARARCATNRALTAGALPLRFAGVGYAPGNAERGACSSGQSADLYIAVARVMRGVAGHPDDPHWLQLKGRLDLLDCHEDAAIAELERAQALDRRDPYLLSDLGAAYYQKAEKTDDPQFYAQAFESFSKADALKHNDPVLLFNKALGAQHIFAPHAEQEAWKAYLQVDAGSGWAIQARSNRDKVKQKLDRQRAYSAATTADALVAEFRRGVPWNRLFAPDEEYLGVAVTRLLPAYYGTPPDEAAGHILHGMADAFVARHQDTWLRDVLRTSHSAQAGEAFRALGQAGEAFEAGQRDREGEEAEKAMRLFQSAGSRAGEFRAEFEGLQVLYLLGKPCATEGQALVSRVPRNEYSWLTVQALIGASVCEFRNADFERVWANRSAATELAKQHLYSALWLRALGQEAMWNMDIGNISAAWRQNMQGLNLYWTSNYPLIRAQSIYVELSLLAPRANTVYAEVAWAKENLEAIRSMITPDYYALHLLALAEMSAGMWESAEKHFQESARRPPKSYLSYLSISRAEAEAKLGMLDRARARLESVQGQVDRAGDTLQKLQFNADLGQVKVRLGDYSGSERSLYKALAIGEIARRKLTEGDSLSWTRSMGDTYRALVECDVRRGASPQHAWAKWSSYRAALSNQETVRNPAGEPAAPGEAMLSFAELPSGIGVWLSTPHGFHFQWLAPAARDTAARLVRHCTNAQSPLPVLRADAQDLSRWLLGPWEKELEGVNTVVVESDGPVSSLPWDALVLSNGHYWSDEFATRIRVGAGASQQPRVPVALAKSILAVGAPALEGNQDLPPLPDALEEAKKVSSLFPRSIRLVGRQATLTEVRDRIEDAEIFHFAGHGYGGAGGGLILRGAGGGPALLKAADIQDLHLSRCRLAVLSGCSTGAGERNGPGDPQSLVRAFLHAKTGEVVASFWNLNSAATQLLIDHFYNAILLGKPTDQCLRAATAAVRAHPEYQHPYYWAGLQVFSLH